ncbi:hypothetical protein ROLI_005690 [Roseobacter fucihabitans]|uniref:Uncharacterized protein n=1 Tax=Roseobacter fucihabitans TaxID=1537242 RepID=A0ABZ2BQJ0_9RHOB|nr:hypothetical protein [Roseobacter litoralis]MBC6964741.1 hypothetical protein [Roseobacter litoralis]
MKPDPIVKYLLACVAALSAGVAFAFKFLLEARDYPELSLVMLAVVAFVIGTICLFAALAVCGVLGSAFAEALKTKQNGTGDAVEDEINTATEIETETFTKKVPSLPTKIILIITGFFGLCAAFVLLLIGFAAFHFATDHLGSSLGIFRDHLESQIN